MVEIERIYLTHEWYTHGIIISQNFDLEFGHKRAHIYDMGITVDAPYWHLTRHSAVQHVLSLKRDRIQELRNTIMRIKNMEISVKSYDHIKMFNVIEKRRSLRKTMNEQNHNT